MPTEHVSWITQALAALGITVGGAGVRAAIKQRELDVRVCELETGTAKCHDICAQTQQCMASQEARIGALSTGIERNFTAISELTSRIDRILEQRPRPISGG